LVSAADICKVPLPNAPTISTCFSWRTCERTQPGCYVTAA